MVELNRIWKGCWVLAPWLLLSACSTLDKVSDRLGPTLSGNLYLVAAEDTLESIAWRYQVSPHELAAWNQLAKPYVLSPGQKLVVAGPALPRHVAAAKAPPVRRPAGGGVVRALPKDRTQVRTTTTRQKSDGRIVTAGRESKINGANKLTNWVWPVSGKVKTSFANSSGEERGIKIEVTGDRKVKAVGAGEVIYAGANIDLLGSLVIIDHGDDLLTAYANNESLLVAEGVKVQAGEVIADLGSSNNKKPTLHFQVRKNGEPVDPEKYLP